MFGSKPAVLAALVNFTQDTDIRDLIVKKVQSIPDGGAWDSGSHVLVSGHGHAGQIGKLEITPLNALPEPVPVAPPVSNDNVAPGCEKFTTEPATT